RANRPSPTYGCDPPDLVVANHGSRVPSLPVRSDGRSRQQSVDVHCSSSPGRPSVSIAPLASSTNLLSLPDRDPGQLISPIHQYDVHSTREKPPVEVFH